MVFVAAVADSKIVTFNSSAFFITQLVAMTGYHSSIIAAT
jgi:hypothetical protein